MPDPVRKSRRPSSSIGILAILVAIILVGAVAWVAIHIVSNKPQNAEHEPILIKGSLGFTKDNGVVKGSGTGSDPYIIADWHINASLGNGISIGSTDMHFVIRNCEIYGTPGHQGITLSDCVNGILMYNNCSNASSGIAVSTSDNIRLIGNNCSNDDYGIWLYESDDNMLANNTCSLNNLNGIKILSSDNNTLINNNCSANREDGVNFYRANDGNTLVNNTCKANGKDGVYMYQSTNSTLISNKCSLNHGAGIGLYSSIHNTLSNNDCLNNTRGIYLYFTSGDNTLNNNNCSSNSMYGIHLESTSDNNEISWNQVCSNLLGGAMIWGSNSYIWNNTFIANNGATQTHNESHAQAYDNLAQNWWSNRGYGNYWSDWTTPDANHDGIVDLAYSIPGYSPGGWDSYPLTMPPVSSP